MLRTLKQFYEIRANTHEYTHEDQENALLECFLDVLYKRNLECLFFLKDNLE